MGTPESHSTERPDSNFSTFSGTSAPQNQANTTFNRTQKACDFCRKRKTKCTGEVPCACCVLHKVECTHNYIRKKRTTYKKSGNNSKKIKMDPTEAISPIPGLQQNVLPGFSEPNSLYSSVNNTSQTALRSTDSHLQTPLFPNEQQRNQNHVDQVISEDNMELINSRIRSLESCLNLVTTRLESVTKMQQFTLDRLMQVLDSKSDSQFASMNNTHQNQQKKVDSPLLRKTDNNTSISPIPSSIYQPQIPQSSIYQTPQLTQVAKPSNRKMRIADIIDRDVLAEKNSKKQVLNSLMDLINSGTSMNVFESAAFQWIRKITGKNFDTYFQPLVDEHRNIVKQKKSSLKRELNTTQSYTEHFVKYKDLIITLVTNVIQLQMKNFYLGGKTYITLMKDVLSKFLLFMEKLSKGDKAISDILSDSDNLLLNSMICLSCTYSHSRLFSLIKEGSPKFKYTYADDKAICVSKKNLLEIEDLSMKNCFFYFNKLIDHHEGEKTIIALLTLCSYLNSTIFTRCNYAIMSVTAKHVQNMGLHKSHIIYTDNNEVDLTQLSSTILWWRCYMTDKDISSTVEKRPIIKQDSIRDDIFLEFSKVIMIFYCKRRKIVTNSDFERLKKVKLNAEKSITDQKEFFAILNNISKYNAFGYSILINYYIFTLIKLIVKHSKEVFFNNIIRGVGENDSSESLDAFFKALEVNDYFNKDFRVWELTVPESIRPSSKLDTSEYFNFDVSIFPYLQYFDGTLDVSNNFMVLDGFKIDFEGFDSNDRSNDYNYLLQAKFKYFFHLMKVNRLAYNSCYILYSRLDTFDSLNFEQRELARKTLLSKMKKYESIYIENAVNILLTSLGSSIHILDVIYCGNSFILSAFFVIFMYIVSRFTEGVQTVCINDSISLSEYINLLHILIDCYVTCFSESAVVVRHLKSNFFENLARRSIMLCIANLNDKSDYDIYNDYKVIQFNKKRTSVDINFENMKRKDNNKNNNSYQYSNKGSKKNKSIYTSYINDNNSHIDNSDGDDNNNNTYNNNNNDSNNNNSINNNNSNNNDKNDKNNYNDFSKNNKTDIQKQKNGNDGEARTTIHDSNFKLPSVNIASQSQAIDDDLSVKNVNPLDPSASQFTNYFGDQFTTPVSHDNSRISSNGHIATELSHPSQPPQPTQVNSAPISENLRESTGSLFDDSQVILNTNVGDPGNMFTNIDESDAFSLNGSIFIDSDLLSMNFNF